MISNAEELLRAALAKMPQGLVEHVLRVTEEVERLAALHGVDPVRARIAALGHDILRAHAPKRLLTIAREQGYPMHEADRIAPVLMHGPLAVPILREQYGVHDADVLGAVASHTTAAPGMSPLQKVLFLADKTEIHKMDEKPELLAVRDLARTDLDAALAAYLDYHLTVAIERRWPLHPHTIDARNELLAHG